MTQNPADYDFTAPSPEELAPFFPAYKINGFVAQGGMGAVYSATQTSLDRPVAIKILPKVFSNDPQFQATFESEAKAMARLSHSNLIAVFDFGEADGMLYIVMELVDGKSLHDSCRGESIEQKEAGRLVSEICRGLAHAHKAGIIHRDIKPGNILLTSSAEPKIGDFGLAHPLGESVLNEGGYIWGTPGYSAPEVVDNPDGVDQRTDIFAVGILLFELLTGGIPATPPGLPSVLSGCDAGFDTVFQRAAHPDPAKRYPDADAMAQDIDTILQQLKNPAAAAAAKGSRLVPGAAKKRGAIKRPVALRTGAASRPLATPTAKKSSAPIVISLVAVVAVIGLIAFVFSGQNKNSDSSSGKSGNPKAVTNPKASSGKTKTAKSPPSPEEIAKSPDPDKTDPAELSPKVTPDPVTDPAPEPPAPVSFSVLAKSLGNGDFTELPEGAVQIGSFVFLLVNEPATWRGALQKAEEAGAQLAVFDSPKAIAWASVNLKSDSPLWLGLSDSGTEGKWYWANGTPLNAQLWAPGQGGEGDKINFGALLPGSQVLDDLEESLELPFVIQWVENRKAPGTLNEQMSRLGQNFRAKQPPVFPTGSINVGGSRFLLVPQKVSWEAANTAAVTSGGHLAVPSFQEEADWIAADLGKLLGDGNAAWMGGRFTGGTWKFATGELFYFLDWADGEPEAPAASGKTFLAVRPNNAGAGRLAAGSGNEGEADYYVVEWSAPSRRNMPGPDGDRSATEWLTSYRNSFLRDQGKPIDGVSKEVRENAQSWIRSMKRDTEDLRQFSGVASRYIDSLEEEVERTGRVPDELPREAVAFIGESHEKALGKQSKREGKSSGAVEKSKVVYQSGLETEVTRRVKIGDKKGTAYLKADREQAQEDNYFGRILGGENPQPTPDPEPSEDGTETPSPKTGSVFGVDR